MVLRLPDSWSNWNLEMLVFEERGKPEYLSEQRREPTTNSTHICRRRRDLNPGHIGGRRALSPLRNPLLLGFKGLTDCFSCRQEKLISGIVCTHVHKAPKSGTETFLICGDSSSTSAGRIFVPLQKSGRNHLSCV